MQETNLKDLEGIEDKFLISDGGSYLLTLEDAPTLIRRRATTAGGTQRRTSPSMKRSSAPLPGVRTSRGGRFPRGARMRRGSGTMGGNSLWNVRSSSGDRALLCRLYGFNMDESI